MAQQILKRGEQSIRVIPFHAPLKDPLKICRKLGGKVRSDIALDRFQQDIKLIRVSVTGIIALAQQISLPQSHILYNHAIRKSHQKLQRRLAHLGAQPSEFQKSGTIQTMHMFVSEHHKITAHSIFHSRLEGVKRRKRLAVCQNHAGTGGRRHETSVYSVQMKADHLGKAFQISTDNLQKSIKSCLLFDFAG